MADLLTDKVALVTGAGRGIGRAIAIALAGECAMAALTGRNTGRLEQVMGEIQLARGRGSSLADGRVERGRGSRNGPKDLRPVGRIDILVNNAGIIHSGNPVWQTSISDWDEEMAINLRGTFLCCYYVLPRMVGRKEGVVIIVGSSSGTIPEDMSGAYGATKWGVIGYTTSLVKSVRPHEVRVNGLNPGWVETCMRPLRPRPAPGQNGPNRKTSPGPRCSWPPTPRPT